MGIRESVASITLDQHHLQEHKTIKYKKYKKNQCSQSFISDFGKLRLTFLITLKLIP